MGYDAVVIALAEPLADRLTFFIGGFQNSDFGRGTVEYRNRSGAFFRDPIDIGYFGVEQSVSLCSDLVGGSVINVQRPGAPANIDTERLPGKRLLKNPLPEIASEKQSYSALLCLARRETGAARR